MQYNISLRNLYDATKLITSKYISLQHRLLPRIIFGCKTVYHYELFLVATTFIATNYFWLQHHLLPRKIRVAIEAITTPLVMATNGYVRGKKGLLPGQWSWQQMTTSVA